MEQVVGEERPAGEGERPVEEQARRRTRHQ